ncbi:C_GCAxxG_C_C family probable redox protein [Desulfomicrobium norvegicum]|uniref:C_GCAxxG_C_C family probable redox protein n=1 Tax=Desulfomicrobium norvegicum (strain DSM 1741 / NCIMB 8310) TaxID=52561 RepID=A0A8G2C348_DESNO|nr:C-GCAxxG-C-C family protein [Desulfomicrobium norvegicum]SFL76966.1 C_GCAxxG_C_C family probable redox protein [Desulfomicrobium norvegicum]
MEPSVFHEVRTSAEEAFASGYYCAESVVLAVARFQGVESDLPAKMATALCSGLSRTCGPCGALTGAILAVSLVLGRTSKTDSVEPAYAATRRLVDEFEKEFGGRDCRTLLDGCDLGTPEGQAMFTKQGFVLRCTRFTGKAAEMAARIIAQSRG